MDGEETVIALLLMSEPIPIYTGLLTLLTI